MKLLAIAALLIFVGFMTMCVRMPLQTVVPPEATILPQKSLSNEPILPIPTEVSLDTGKVELGEKLFNDARLSHDNTISCASCHNLSLGGTDQTAHSTGIKGQVGDINAPTVFNAANNFKQFWDGRAETLEAQIDGPTHASDEMGSTWDEIIGKLRQSPEYVSEFKLFYQDGIQT